MKRTKFRVLIPEERVGYLDFKDLPETMEDLGYGIIASYLTKDQYTAQMMDPDSLWKCPVTKETAEFDDDWYEAHMEE